MKIPYVIIPTLFEIISKSKVTEIKKKKLQKLIQVKIIHGY